MSDLNHDLLDALTEAERQANEARRKLHRATQGHDAVAQLIERGQFDAAQRVARKLYREFHPAGVRL